MEDIYKIIFYIIAVTLWIIYKAREQKNKGGIGSPPVNKPEVNYNIPENKTITSINQYQRKPDEKIVKAKISVKPPASQTIKTPAIDLYPGIIIEEISDEIIKKENNKSENEILFSSPNINEPFVFNVKQAVLGSEILKRPLW